MAYERNPMFDPKQEFACRLARIEAGGLHTNRTLFVGLEEQLELPAGTFVRKRKAGRRMPVLLVLSLCAAGMAAAVSLNF